MHDLADQHGLDRTVESVLKTLAQRKNVVIDGGTGSGRSVLARKLRDRGHLLVEPPGLDDPDAPLHALLQAAPDKKARDLAQQDELPLVERARGIGSALAAASRVVVLRIPHSWRSARVVERSADEMLRARRARDVVIGLSSGLPEGSLVVVGTAADLGEAPATIIALPRMVVMLNQLDPSDFGAYEKFAKEVAFWCSTQRAEPTPLQFRVAVALRAMDAIDADTIDMLGERSSLQLLENRLVNALGRHASKRRAATRAVLARVPIPRSALKTVSRIGETDEPLLTECLGYPTDEGIVFHERIRAAILSVPDDDDRLREEAHAALAAHHHTLDGVADPSLAGDVVQWLETTHHLAHAGVDAAARWSARTLRCRELYWDRGRALSLAKHYREAADVYAVCLERCGDDDTYAHHYLAFNLDKLGADPARAQEEFELAIHHGQRDNPWWNSRYVTHLVSRAQFVRARRAFFDALKHVDPDGDRVRDKPWIARHFHRHVVGAWLRAGEVELAREAFDTIPPRVIDEDPDLRRLAQRLADAEEGKQLGESVYPATTPMHERWMEPRFVPAANAHGAMRRAWYPGRVIAASNDAVMIVFGVPAAEPSQRRSKVREMTPAEWDAAAGSAARSGFIEIGSYGDGSVTIVPVAPEPKPDDTEEDELRWLRRWRIQ